MNAFDAVTPEAAERVAPVPAGAITIHQLGAGDVARWERFVIDCPEATFFHKAGWKQVIERSFGHRTWFLYAEQNGAIVGILALAQIKSRLFGNSLSSLPFCVSGGIAACDEGARPSSEFRGPGVVDRHHRAGLGAADVRDGRRRDEHEIGVDAWRRCRRDRRFFSR